MSKDAPELFIEDADFRPEHTLSEDDIKELEMTELHELAMDLERYYMTLEDAEYVEAHYHRDTRRMMR